MQDYMYRKGILKLIELIDQKWAEEPTHDISDEENYLSTFCLWNILAAIRGPDDDSNEMVADRIKSHTTTRIRNWIKYLAKDEEWPDRREWSVLYTYNYVQQNCGNHFARHLLLAEKTIQHLDPGFKVFNTENGG